LRPRRARQRDGDVDPLELAHGRARRRFACAAPLRGAVREARGCRALAARGRARARARRAGRGRPRHGARRDARLEHAHVEGRLAARVDAVDAGALARRERRVQLGADVVNAREVVGGDAGREAFADELRVAGPPQLLAVVVRAGAARQEAESVPHALELRAERVGHPGLEPADHPGAPAGEHDAGLPGLAEDPAEAVDAPDGEHVRRAAAGDEDHVVGERELAQVLRRPGVERQRRHLRVPFEGPVVARARGPVDEDAAPAGELEHVFDERGLRVTTEGDDLRRGHDTRMTTFGGVARFVFDFDEPAEGGRELLGGKGIGLAEMTQLGIPVPAGFTITTDACRAYLREGGLPEGLEEEIRRHVERLEARTGKRLGDPNDPLLVSVRSGAAISMPGMMDTILNVGLSDESVAGLARTTQNEEFARDCYRRLIEMYGETVDDVSYDRDVHDVDRLKEAYRRDTGRDFPQDAREQLRRAVIAVFESWNSPRAQVYRRTYDIPDDIGTAVNVVQMVFGNKGDRSATGVCFTRNPSTGEQGLYGEYLVNAQGEDVVAGIRTPQPIEEMRERLPEAFDRLVETMARLEQHYRDMQDIEFTIEDGTLYLLQTRSAKRTAAAALKAAVDMAGEGLISRDEAIARIDPGQLDQLLHPMLDPNAELEVAARGLNASPGAACGHVVLDADTAEERGKAGEAVILVRWETTPDDIHGVIQAKGVLTAHGGMTSHAAVVARGMGKPCVAGCEGLDIDLDARTLRLGGHQLREGDTLTIDGTTGRVVIGEVALVPPQIN